MPNSLWAKRLDVLCKPFSVYLLILSLCFAFYTKTFSFYKDQIQSGIGWGWSCILSFWNMVKTHWRPTNQPTNQPTNRPTAGHTLSHIELLLRLKRGKCHNICITTICLLDGGSEIPFLHTTNIYYPTICRRFNIIWYCNTFSVHSILCGVCISFYSTSH